MGRGEKNSYDSLSFFFFCLWLCPWACRASLVAQTVKNPPATQETWVWSLGWEDPLEEGIRVRRPTPEFLPGESHGQRSLAGCSPWVEKVRHNRAMWHSSACRILVPSQGLNLGPQEWKHTALATGPPGNSLSEKLTQEGWYLKDT